MGAEIRDIGKHLQFYIDGQWVDPLGEQTIDVINPATQEPIATIALANRPRAHRCLRLDHPVELAIEPDRGQARSGARHRVLKPSEIAPVSALIVAEVMHEAGVPAGVFNLINGDGPTVGVALSSHPEIDMISITGSTRAGASVAEHAAKGPVASAAQFEKIQRLIQTGIDEDAKLQCGGLGRPAGLPTMLPKGARLWFAPVMLPFVGRRGRLAWVSCLLLACVGSPSEPTIEPTTQPEAEAARAFQIEYERELRADEHSFLTVVAAHYLAPGRQLRLAWNGSTWAPTDDTGIRLESTADALLVEQDAGVQRIADRGVIQADSEGRFSFTASRQESDWRVLVHDRDAPLRREFPGIAWFPIDATAIVKARFDARATREPSVVQTSRGVTKTLYVAGEAHFELDRRPLSLLVFGYAPEPSPDEPLLIPFRDETSGHESYTAGRYLEPTLPEGGALLLDFNRATNPLCAYSEHYNCPMPPRFNTLPVAIRAGAMAPEAH